MIENRPSTTAQRVAMRRAAHQILDDPPVFNDPVALRIVGEESASALRADPRQFETSPLSPYLRAFLAARSRCAEEELALGVERGVGQYVILGAGLDTFAYRNPQPTEAVMATLQFIASDPAGSGVVFGYTLSPSLLTAGQRSSFDALARRVALAGEPWQAFFDPVALTKDLMAMGFGYVEDKGPDEINAKYFKNRKDGLRVGSLSHLMTARV